MAYDLTTVLGGGGGIKSVQRGIVNMSNSQAVDTTITAVDTSKSFVTHSQHTRLTGALDQALASAQLTSSTNIQCYKYDGVNTTYVAWEVVEFA
jgi:hypothetical protein